MQKIWVLGECAKGALTSTTLELTGAARRFATHVEVFVWNADGSAVAPTLGQHGATKVFSLGDLGDRLPAPLVAGAVVSQIAADGTPDAILAPSSYDGRDIAARLSVRMDRPVLANVVGLETNGDRLNSVHAIFGGTKIVKARFDGEAPGIFVVRAKSFAAEPNGEHVPEVVAVPVPESKVSAAATITARFTEAGAGVKLDEAEVVVAGGRGLGSKKNYALIEELAQLLNGAAGASRAIVDADWVPYAYQVGQTGKVVKPKVYIAVGISGAIQHMVGMQDSANIIAINTDPKAPIFAISDLGIIGDANAIVPQLIEALKARG